MTTQTQPPNRAIRIIGIAILIAVLVSSMRRPAQAAPSALITVGTGIGCLYSTLSQALTVAQDGDAILIALPSIDTSNTFIIEDKSLTIIGGYANNCAGQATGRTVLNQKTGAPSFNLVPVIQVTDTTNSGQRTLVLQNLELTGGDPFVGSGGGLVATNYDSVTLRNTHVYGNSTNEHGGGIAIEGGELILEQGSAVYNNQARGDGGGIYCKNGAVTLTDSTVGVNGMNRADTDSAISNGGSGGGIYANACDVDVTDSAVANNKANGGGGIAAEGAVTVSMHGAGAEVTSNESTTFGGGIWMNSSPTASGLLLIQGGMVTDNQAAQSGGGLFLPHSARLNFNNSNCPTQPCAMLTGNRSYGSGGGLQLSLGADAEIDGVTISGNTAALSGAAINSFGSLLLQNSVVSDQTGNVETINLGFSASTEINFSTIAYNNLTSTKPALTTVSKVAADGIIMWGNGSAQPFTGSVGDFVPKDSLLEDMTNVIGTNNMIADPLFVQNGPQGDYHIQPSSPAVNYAVNSSVTSFFNDDIDAELRPTGFPAILDAGADEITDFFGLNGASCSYETFDAVLSAATANDSIYIAPGTYEMRIGDISEDLTFIGATPDCTAVSTTDNAEFFGANLPAQSQGGLIRVVDDSIVTLVNIALNVSPPNVSQGGLAWVEAGSTLILDDAFLLNAQANVGGGIYTNGNVTMRGNTRITSNGATNGAGVYVGPQALLAMEDSARIGTALTQNIATQFGGGVYVNAGTVTMSGTSSINGNVAVDGGGIYAYGQSIIDIASSGNAILWNQASQNGGGIYARDGLNTMPSAQVMVSGGAAFWRNSAENGGAFYGSDVESLILHDATFNENTAQKYGGGIYFEYVGNDLIAPFIVMSNTVVSNNQAVDNDGGGTYLASDSALYINNSTFSDNEANLASGAGGAIACGYCAIVTAIGTQFADNEAFSGGAIHHTNGDVTIETNSAFEGNDAGGDGGAIYSGINATLVISAENGFINFEGNTAGDAGGAIYNVSGELLELSTASGGVMQLVDNMALGGSGGALYVDNATDLSIAGSVEVSTNEAGDQGGGIYQNGGDGAIVRTVDGRPFIGLNIADEGGGLYLNDVVQSGGSLSGPYLDGVLVSGNSTVQGNGGGIFTYGSDLEFINTVVENNRATDSKFIPTQSRNGGGLYIEAGSNITVADSSSCNPMTLPTNTYCSEFRGNVAVEPEEPRGSVSYGGAVYVGEGTFAAFGTAFIGNKAFLGAAVATNNDTEALNFVNSLVVENEGSTAIWVNSMQTVGADGVNILNTTVTANVGDGIRVADGDDVEEYTNNIVWDEGVMVESGSFFAECSISADGNTGQMTDPLFTTTARGNYRLGAGSPAIDACNKGTAIDLDQQSRPFDAGASTTEASYDMGAFEVQTVPTAVGLVNGEVSAEISLHLMLGIVLLLVTLLMIRERTRHD